MPKVSPIQNNFSSGELSPLFYGRVDSERYKTALKICLNYIPVVQGGLPRRSGTRFVAEVKDSTKKTRLVPFEFSVTQAYIIEFGDQYLRFYKDNGQILSGPPYEIVTPYLEADLFQLKFTQSADVLYIVHPNYAPRKLTRTAHTNWTLTVIDILDGPYLPTNSTTTTLTPSAATGAITITASAVTGINNNQGFLATDVGRLVRIRNTGSVWGYAKITGFTSSTVVNADVKSTFGAGTAGTTWRLGVWSETTGYPAAIVFHEDRLFMAGPRAFPQRLDGSRSGDYENYAPTDTDTTGTVTASHALGFSLNANDVNVIRWLTSDEKGMLAGTVGGEWVVKPSSQSEALSPTNINAKRATSYGSANVQPVQVGKASLFVQRSGQKLREMTYFFEVDGFRCPDMTLLSEHITQSGIVEMAFQKEPQPIVWTVRADGKMAAVTYERDQDALKVGWHRHILGGFQNAAGDDAKVESVACIPSTTGTRTELWVVVQRYINGAVKRYVEYMTPLFEDTVAQRNAIFVDSSLTLDNPKTISNITQANPAVVTSTAHGFSNGDKVQLLDIVGMGELNDTTAFVANAAANTFELQGVNSTGFAPYVSGGQVRKMVSTVSGLTHLEGQTVSILADGAVHPNQVVTAGAVPLQIPAAVVHVGLPYNSDGQMLRIDAGSADGTSLGKKRRQNEIRFLVHRSLGLKYGTSFDELDEMTFRTSADAMTHAPELYSGVLDETLPSNYDTENEFCWRQDQPLPSMILAVMPQMVTQD
ncbi:MAG: hypothetical protein IPI97_14610 [Nitrosomonas sp.]|nr:hypothetical protein [Nitrosomonas sp.]